MGVRRREVEDYLCSLGQEWREDATNRDVKHMRNKVRHELLPLLEAEYNPNIYQQLADAAEVARAEEEFWSPEVGQFFLAPGLKALSASAGDAGLKACSPSQSPRHAPSTALKSARDDNQNQTQGPSTRPPQRASLGMTNPEDSNGSETGHAPSLREDYRLERAGWFGLEALLKQPLALRRRVLRAAFERASGKTLDFEHTDALVRFLERRESSRLQLPERRFAVLDWPRRAVWFEERKAGTRGAEKSSKPKKKAGRKQEVGGRKIKIAQARRRATMAVRFQPHDPRTGCSSEMLFENQGPFKVLSRP